MTRRFTKSHEWIELDEKVGTVGITHYAQKELGEIVYVQLPAVDQEFQAGAEVCVLESTKAAADVYCPVSGKIIAINEALASNPQLINQSPEAKAWLFRIELSKPEEFTRLLSKSEYEHLIK
jgi:glycine cleavage system H protein